MAQLRTQFHDDGVVCVARALDEQGIALAESAFQWSLQHPGASAGDVLAGRPGAFYQDHSNPAAAGVYRGLLDGTCIPSLVAQLLGSDSLWLLYEQIWMKHGSHTRRTPWHQDLAYIPLEGDHLAVVWLISIPCRASGRSSSSADRIAGRCSTPARSIPTTTRRRCSNQGSGRRFPTSKRRGPSGRSCRGPSSPATSWCSTRPCCTAAHLPATENAGGQSHCASSAITHTAPNARRTALADVDRLKRDDGGRDPIEQLAACPPGTLFRHPGFPKVL